MKSRHRKILAFSTGLFEPTDEFVECPTCRTPLELHQPDIEQPDRLLGICRNCHGWALVQSEPDGSSHITPLASFN